MTMTYPIKLKGNSLLYKYLASHLLSMIIPLVILLLVFNLSFVKLVREQSIEAERKNLALIMKEVDALFMQMDRLHNQIQVDKNLRPFRLKYDPYHGTVIVDMLAGYTTVNEDITGIILNFTSDETYYFSNTSTLEKDSLSYHCPLPLPMDWADLLSPKEENISVLDELYYFDRELNDILLFSYPLYNVKSYGGVVFIVPLERILARIPQLAIGETALTVSRVKGRKKNLLLSTITDRINQDQSLVLENTSSHTGLSYELILPRNYIFAAVDNVTRLILIVILIILILGVGTAAVGSVWNYRKLDQLRKQLNDFPVSDGSTDVLDYIGHSLTKISALLKESDRARKESLIRRLLRGETIPGNGLIKNDNFFSVAVLNLPSSLRQSRQELIDSLESYPWDDWVIYAVSDILTGRILLLFSYSEHLSRRAFLANAESFFATLLSDLEPNLTMGLSHTCGLIASLPECKEEAIRSGEMGFIHGTGRLYSSETYQELTEKGRNDYPSTLLQHYRTALTKKNIHDAEQMIDNLLQFVKERKLSIYTAKGISYELISIILITLSSDPEHMKNLSQLHGLDINKFGTIDEFGLYLKQYIKENISSKREPVSHPMTDYIRETYRDVDFSLSRMGDAFDLTVPNLCHLFKEEVGTTILDYTSRLKMEKARNLLKAGKLNIGEIAYEVGYANTNSFIRRFRQLNGLSPGEFRKSQNSPTKRV